MPRVASVAQGQGYTVGRIDRVALLVWLAAPSVAGVEALNDVLRECRSKYPAQKVGFFTMITRAATHGELPAAAREALINTLKSPSTGIGAAAITYEDEGFRATVVRSVITSIQLLARPKFAAGVYSNREVAARELLPQLGLRSLSETELLSALGELLDEPQTVQHTG